MRFLNLQAERNRQRLVRLIWLYFALLIMEGGLRKWILPQWSDALLIARDPVAAAMLYFAFQDGYLPIDNLMRGLGWLLIGFLALSCLQGIIYGVPVPALLFGLRSYFLHPPLIFVMARVLNVSDLRRLMRVTLIVAVPIALLMVEQFGAAQLDWINRGAGEGRLQLESALGKVRPAGPFSFLSGPVFYYSLTLAFLIGSHFSRTRVSPVIQASGWAALLTAAAVSGSRSLVFGLIPVILMVGAAIVKVPNFPVARFIRMSLMLAVVVMIVCGSTVVQEGLEVFAARMDASGGARNMLARSNDEYLVSLSAWTNAPLIGLGVGLGTNAANALLGTSFFRFGEGEWTRTIFEAGPLFGTAYLAWRVWLVVQLLRLALKAVSLGELLPMAIVGASLTNLVLGPWGQPTTQGFAVWTAGLCMAACRVASLDAGRDRRAAAARWTDRLHQHAQPLPVAPQPSLARR